MLEKRRGRLFMQILVLAIVFGLVGVSGAVADSGWFAGASVGQTKWKNYDEELASYATSIDDSDTGWFAFGGYQVHKYFSAIAGYADLGEMYAEGYFDEFYAFEDRIGAKGPVVAAMGTIPVAKKFTVFAMLGVFFWDQDIEYYDDFIGPWNGGVSGNGMMYGLGGTFWIGPNNSSGIHAEYMKFDSIGDIDDPESGHENDVDMISVGYVYRWGI